MAQWVQTIGPRRRFTRISGMSPLVGYALTLGLVLVAAWFARDQLPALLEPLLRANPGFAVAALACLMAVEVVKAFRWQVLFGAHKPPFWRVLQATVVGLALNAVLPLRVGELARVSWAAPSGSGLARGAASLVLSKGTDALILAVIVVLAFGGSVVHQPLALIAAAGVCLVIIGAVLARRHSATTLAPSGRPVQLMRAGLQYARELGPSTLFIVVAASAAAWVIGGLANAAVLAALGQNPSPDLALRILASGYLAGLLPAPPGRVGVFEAAVAAALVSGGLPVATALSVALALHALQLLEIAALLPAAIRWR